MNVEEVLTKILIELEFIKEALRKEPATPVAADPLPEWTRPADLDENLAYTGDLVATQDYAEARRRAKYGFTYTGSRALVGGQLLAAWAEIDTIKGLTQETVKTYRRGQYAVLDPDLSCFLVLTNVIDLYETPFMSPPSYAQFAGLTVETFLDSQWNASGGPSGAPV